MTAMIDHRPVVFSRNEWQRLSARLMLAHLEDDEDLRAFYRDLVRYESGVSAESFTFADTTAHTFAQGYVTPEARERVRAQLTNYLEERS